MSDFEIWAYRIVIAALGGVLWWVITWAVKRVSSKLDEVIDSIKELTTASKTQQEQINNQNRSISAQNDRLNDHAKRIRNLELENKSK